MSNKAMVLFPYSGFQTGTGREDLFWRMISCAQLGTEDKALVVILNRDTEIRGRANAFLDDSRSKDLDVQRTWSVDTCQMWLSGWGYILDRCPETRRIIQLPGDLDEVQEPDRFFANVRNFIQVGEGLDFVVGDFSSRRNFSAKDLIDRYGTYALLANWFPQVAQAILKLPLLRPRSEFLNLKVEVLQGLLVHRKFAYEQTLNMLIRSWDFSRADWSFRVGSYELGILSDDNSLRQYQGCIEQIERTERMLKLLWREKHGDLYQSDPAVFSKRFRRLDRLSTATREAAAVTISSLLGLES